MSVGIVNHGLASLVIGEWVVGNNTIPKQLAAPIMGALIYQQIHKIFTKNSHFLTDSRLCYLPEVPLFAWVADL